MSDEPNSINPYFMQRVEHDNIVALKDTKIAMQAEEIRGLHAELEGYRIANKRIRTELGELAASYEGIVAERDHYRNANVKLQEQLDEAQ